MIIVKELTSFVTSDIGNVQNYFTGTFSSDNKLIIKLQYTTVLNFVIKSGIDISQGNLVKRLAV